MTPQEPLKPQDDTQADGYYGDDDMGSDELDLSFLDENESSSKK